MIIEQERNVWVVYTNTDLTEGRGHSVPIAVCELEATAIRLAKKQGVMGSDADVRKEDLLHINGYWYAPIRMIQIKSGIKEDLTAQTAMDNKAAAIAKARAAGLSEDDIKAIAR